MKSSDFNTGDAVNIDSTWFVFNPPPPYIKVH